MDQSDFKLLSADKEWKYHIQLDNWASIGSPASHYQASWIDLDVTADPDLCPEEGGHCERGFGNVESTPNTDTHSTDRIPSTGSTAHNPVQHLAASEQISTSRPGGARRPYAPQASTKLDNPTAFILSEDLDFKPTADVLRLTSRVRSRRTTAKQYPAQEGWRFEVIPDSACPGGCGNTCSRLMHRWRENPRTYRMQATDILAVCYECRIPGWDPIPTCRRKRNKRGTFCDTWCRSFAGSTAGQHAYCPSHLEEHRSQVRDRVAARKAKAEKQRGSEV